MVNNAQKSSQRLEIERFVRFVDEHLGDGDGEMTQMELQDAFHLMHRQLNKRAIRDRKTGIDSMKRMHDAICQLYALEQDPIAAWFREADKSNAGRGDGLLTKLELRAAKDELVKLTPEFHMSEAEFLAMVKFADSDAGDDLDAAELAGALKKAARGESDSELSMLEDLSPFFLSIEKHMALKHWRIVDLFRHIDINDDKTITMKEFCNAIESWGVMPGESAKPPFLHFMAHSLRGN